MAAGIGFGDQLTQSGGGLFIGQRDGNLVNFAHAQMVANFTTDAKILGRGVTPTYSAASVAFPASVVAFSSSAALASTSDTMCSSMSSDCTVWSVTPER